MTITVCEEIVDIIGLLLWKEDCVVSSGEVTVERTVDFCFFLFSMLGTVDGLSGGLSLFWFLIIFSLSRVLCNPKVSSFTCSLSLKKIHDVITVFEIKVTSLF